MDVEALERLGRLRDSGAITADEFEAEKRRLLGSVPQPIASYAAISVPPKVDFETYVAEPHQPSGPGRRIAIILGIVALLGFGGYATLKYALPKGSSSEEQMVATRSGGDAMLPVDQIANPQDDSINMAVEDSQPTIEPVIPEVVQASKAEIVSAAPEASAGAGGHSLDEVTQRALNSGEVMVWREGGRTGTVASSTEVTITGGVCRTVVVTNGIGAQTSSAVSSTWCRTAGRLWQRR